MGKILLAFLLLRCFGVVVSFCVIDSKKGWWLDCGVRDSYLFRIKDFGGIQANFDLGIGIGDEKGFPNSISKTNQKASGVSNYLPPPPVYHHGNGPPIHHQGYRRNDNGAYQNRRNDFPYQYELPQQKPQPPQTKQKKKKKASWWQRLWGGDSDNKAEPLPKYKKQQRNPQPVTPRYIQPQPDKFQTQKPRYQIPQAQVPVRSVPSLNVPVQQSKHMGSNEWTPISQRNPSSQWQQQSPGSQRFPAQPNSSPQLAAQNQQDESWNKPHRKYWKGDQEPQIDRISQQSPNVYSYKNPSGPTREFAQRSQEDSRLQYFDSPFQMLPPPPPPPHLSQQHRQDHFFRDPERQFVFHAPAVTAKPPPTVGPAMSDLLSVPADTSANTDNVPSFAAKMFIVREAPVEFYPPNYDSGRNRHRKRISVEIPRTKFYCEDQKYLPGIYADAMLGCKMFHLCVPSSVGSTLTSYLCPNGTLFDQSILQCNHWYNVDCESSVKDYDANLALALSYRRINAAHLPLHAATNANTLSLLSQNVNHMQVSNPKHEISKRIGRALQSDVTGFDSQDDGTGFDSQNEVNGFDSQDDTTGFDSQDDTTGFDSQNQVTGFESQNDVTGFDSQNDATGFDSQNDATGLESQHDATGFDSQNDVTGFDSQNDVTGFDSQHAAIPHSRESRELPHEPIFSNEVVHNDINSNRSLINKTLILLNHPNFEQVNNSVTEDVFGPGNNILKELIIRIQKQFRSKKLHRNDSNQSVNHSENLDVSDNYFYELSNVDRINDNNKLREITSNEVKIER